jgi:signal transduction histidine kinase
MSEGLAPPSDTADLRRRAWIRDALIVLAIGGIQIAGTTFAAHRQPQREALDALGFALLAASPLALLFRRRVPVAALYAVLGVTLAYVTIGYPRGPIFFSLIVAFFTVVFTGHRTAAIASLVVGYAGFLWLPYLVGTDSAPGWGPALALAAWLLVLLSAAEFLRVRRERVVERTRMHQEESRRRASEERLRIARELHDALGHNLSLINVQAGVGLHLMEGHPEQARTALSAIKEASKEALTELRSVLDILRQVDDQAPRAPIPSLSRLEDVVNGARAAGIEVRTETVGEARPLPFGVDVAAFRIVQEALTNVARHAGPATATVRVSYEGRDLTVQIDDDGRGASSPPKPARGKGILGMRERVSALGGELETGPRPGGGFRVRARLPMDGAG